MWRADVPPGQLTLLPRQALGASASPLACRPQQSCVVTPAHAHLPTLSVYVPWDQGQTGKQLCPLQVPRRGGPGRRVVASGKCLYPHLVL